LEGFGLILLKNLYKHRIFDNSHYLWNLRNTWDVWILYLERWIYRVYGHALIAKYNRINRDKTLQNKSNETSGSLEK
jgi:hypothetical protein